MPSSSPTQQASTWLRRLAPRSRRTPGNTPWKRRRAALTSTRSCSPGRRPASGLAAEGHVVVHVEDIEEAEDVVAIGCVRLDHLSIPPVPRAPAWGVGPHPGGP